MIAKLYGALLARLEEAARNTAENRERVARYLHCWEECSAKGLAARQDGNREEAYRHLLNALNDLHQVWARTGGRAVRGLDPRLQTTFSRLGELYGGDGAYALLARAIEAASETERALGNHADVAEALTFVASLYRGIGGRIPRSPGGQWLAMADDLKRRALRIRGKTLDSWHVWLRWIHKRGWPAKSPGTILDQVLRGPSDAVAIRAGLAALERDVSENDLRRAYLLERLAGMLPPADATSALHQALAIREGVQGGWHPDVAGTLGDLASIRWSQDHAEEAARLSVRAIGILRRAAAIDDPVMRGTREIFEFMLPAPDITGNGVSVLRRISVKENGCWLLILPTREERPGAPPAPLRSEQTSIDVVLERRPGTPASPVMSTVLDRLGSAMDLYAGLLIRTNRRDEAERLQIEADAFHYGMIRGAH